MQISTEVLYAVAAAIISGLLGVAWKLIRAEQIRTMNAVELKATRQELIESEQRHQRELETLREHFRENIARIQLDQNREFERVKTEMDDMKATMREFQRETQQSFGTMRKDQQEGVDRVLNRMQELLLQIKS